MGGEIKRMPGTVGKLCPLEGSTNQTYMHTYKWKFCLERGSSPITTIILTDLLVRVVNPLVAIVPPVAVGILAPSVAIIVVALILSVVAMVRCNTDMQHHSHHQYAQQ